MPDWYDSDGTDARPGVMARCGPVTRSSGLSCESCDLGLGTEKRLGNIRSRSLNPAQRQASKQGLESAVWVPLCTPGHLLLLYSKRYPNRRRHTGNFGSLPEAAIAKRSRRRCRTHRVQVPVAAADYGQALARVEEDPDLLLSSFAFFRRRSQFHQRLHELP
jgi:hypothetical protein